MVAFSSFQMFFLDTQTLPRHSKIDFNLQWTPLVNSKDTSGKESGLRPFALNCTVFLISFETDTAGIGFDYYQFEKQQIQYRYSL